MTISDFSRDAVCRYLHSVVLIDDNLFNASKRHSRQNDLDLDGPPILILNKDEVAPDLATMTIEADEDDRRADDNWVDARSVTDGFAKEGIVCGAFEPKEFPETNFESDGNFKTLLKVCTNADVFILDWHLFRGNQNAVAHLLKHILSEDNRNTSPKPVRFCAIYTAERVDAICDKVYTAFKQIEPSVSKDVDARKVCAGGLTVCVYAKEEATSSGAVAAKDLASRIIADFAKTYEGILPALALRGIALIRENTKRILDKFPATMDPALVLHGGLTVADHSLADDMTLLLADEIRAVLEDDNLDDAKLYPMLAEKVELFEPDVFNDLAADKELVDSDLTPEVLKSFIIDLLRNIRVPASRPFLDYKGEDCSLRRVNKKLLSRLRDMVVRAAGSEKYQAGDLSKLFCQRTIYGANRILKFGTVVKQLGVSDVYYLCVMPLCDCGRLHKAKVNFPFWKLYNAAKHNEGKANGIIVQGEDGQERILCVKGKIKSNLSLHTFRADDVVRFVEKDKHFVVEESLSNGKTKEYEWIAELKPLHVQRMSEHVGREFSHVGLTESEWLRLQVDR